MKERLIIIAEFLLDKFKKELIEQGHIASGKHLESLRYEVLEDGNTLSINFYGEDYGKYLETGTRPHYVPIKALIEWVQIKGIAAGDQDVKNAAYAIQQKILQEGTPTSGSYRFSQNGRRKEWIQYIAETNKVIVEQKILFALSDLVTLKLTNIIKEGNNGN